MSAKRSRSMSEFVEPLDSEQAEEKRTERAALVPINLLVTREDRQRALKLKLDTGMSLQKLGLMAWGMLLEKQGLEPFEPVGADGSRGRTKRRS